MSGKTVVTSNKECVAKYGKELSECAVRNGVSYLYEASVGGGIPIINAMLNALTANKIVNHRNENGEFKSRKTRYTS